MSPSDDGSIPIVQVHLLDYILDGNALFLTATETAWRRATSPHHTTGGIVVAISYPLQQGKIYDLHRRAYDFTPPSPGSDKAFGGANELLDFISGPVKSAIRERFPQVSIAREALYGHSFGGLFAFHALFTRPSMFDCFIASSPSIWWNERFILRETQDFLSSADLAADGRKPALMLSWGGVEQDPPRHQNETAEQWADRRRIDGDFRIIDNTLQLAEMLKSCEHLDSVTATCFEGEEHTSVMASSLSRGLTTFFEDWPIGS